MPTKLGEYSHFSDTSSIRIVINLHSDPFNISDVIQYVDSLEDDLLTVTTIYSEMVCTALRWINDENLKLGK